MQDITEQQELAQEISDAISKPVGLGEQFDEVGERVHRSFPKPLKFTSLCCHDGVINPSRYQA